jgi:hypothetical protein
VQRPHHHLFLRLLAVAAVCFVLHEGVKDD